jgi:ABC-2 type transport system ATP-binding protein
MDSPVIQANGLSKRFGRVTAVTELSLEVPSGQVLALMGANGAGKTTLIRMLLGLLRPDTGSASVLGLDPQRESVRLRQRVGYVPETHHFYPWMQIGEVCRFAAGAYPTWDADTCQGLLRTFSLDPEKRMGGLSRGMTAKVALTLALAHRPRLLVLDEATSGLDAAVRQEFLETMVGVAADEGRTVLISSHLLNEVERVVDHAAFIDRGRLRFVEDVESLRERFREIRLTFADEAPDALDLPGVLQATRLGREWVAVIDNASEARLGAIRERFPEAESASRVLSLQEVFVALQRAAGARESQQEAPPMA